jgi:signal transduction histidine kinase
MKYTQTQRNEVNGALISANREIQSHDHLFRTFEQSMAQTTPAVERRKRSHVEQVKQEWEVTADSLPQLVLLLDGDGRVVRANFTVEKWNLSSVSSVQSKTFHELLHPTCTDAACVLGDKWGEAWNSAREGVAFQYEIDDAILARFVEIQVRPIIAARKKDLRAGSSYAVAVVHDISGLKRAEEAARQLNDDLDLRVKMRTQELRSVNRRLVREIGQHEQTEKALQASKVESQLLSAQLMTAQEVERKRIAAELHDEIGQALSGIKFCVERALREMVTETGGAVAVQTLNAVIPMAQSAIEDVRRIAMNLRPAMLDDLGIRATLAWFFRQYALIYPGFEILKDISLSESMVPKPLKTDIYRLTQEAMNNVAKHARASTVFYTLREHEGLIEIVIKDDGLGFDPLLVQAKTDAAHCMGLMCMKERIELSGGRLNIVTQKGFGTEIRATWPCAKAQSSRSRKRKDEFRV